MNQSPFRAVAIKTTILLTSAFFIAHTVFGKPKIMESAPQVKQQSDTVYLAPSFTYAKLSIRSQSLINDLQGLANRSNLLPENSFVTVPFVLQTITDNSEALSRDPTRAISDLEQRIAGLEEWCKKTGDGWLKAKYLHLSKQLAILKTFLEQTAPGERKQLLSELSKTYVVPAVEEPSAP